MTDVGSICRRWSRAFWSDVSDVLSAVLVGAQVAGLLIAAVVGSTMSVYSGA